MSVKIRIEKLEQKKTSICIDNIAGLLDDELDIFFDSLTDKQIKESPFLQWLDSLPDD